MRAPPAAVLAYLDWPETEAETAARLEAEEQAKAAAQAEKWARWGEGPEAQAGMAAAFADMGIDPEDL